MRTRYARLTERQARGKLLDELIEITGWERKRANKVLQVKRRSKGRRGKRGAPRQYGVELTRVLSEEQWTWLDKQLDAPAKIRFIVSGRQILVSKNTIFEAWSQSGKEQQRLFDLIKRKKANGVIFLSGYQHFVEISTIEKALGYDAIEFTFAGINQDEKESLNDHREGKVVHETRKASYLQIHWDQSPRVSFIATDAAGKTLVSRMVEVSDLQAQ